MQIAIAQIPLFSQQQIAEKTFQKNWAVVDTLYGILVVSPHKRITEVPGMFSEQVVLHIEA